MTDQQDSQPWTWPEDKWRSAVSRARAGRNLRPRKWKGGARCALALTFDCAFETDAITGEGGSIAAIARGQYGARAGLARILRILARNKVQATFFVPAVAALLHPDQIRAIAAGGHEIGLNSWMGETRAKLEDAAERDLLEGARTSLEQTAGMKPVGFRSARDLSDHTIGLIREMGLMYDSSLAADDDPYELEDRGEPTGIIELPIGPTDAILEDVAAGGGATTPEAMFDIFRRDLEVAYQEGGLVVLALNPSVIGRRSNAWVLEEIVQVARTLPGVWMTTCADIAASIKLR